jgi:putative transcription factor
MLCEMCGREVDSVTAVRVEGSILRVCAACAKFGQSVAPPGPATAARTSMEGPLSGGPVQLRFRTRRTEERDLFSELPALELSPDWFRRVRQARERLTWTPEELGKRLNEKKSVVLKIEAGTFRPSDALLRKIERLLKIRLTAEPATPES